jgi:hypothetical protein
MNRYPERQAKQDKDDEKAFGRSSSIRPGDHLRVRGPDRRCIVLGRALMTKVIDATTDAALLSSREYGRQWFENRVTAPFSVVEELS